MAKTSAENQAAYRQRKAEKGSAESTEDGKATEVVAEKLSADSTEEVPTLSPGADCEPEEDAGNGEVPMANTVDPGPPVPIGLPPEPIPPDPVIERLAELLSLVREIHQNKTHPLVEVPIESASKPARGGAPEPVGDLTQCMKCEAKLPPTETPRLVRELCHDCVWRKTAC